jgi:integrase
LVARKIKGKWFVDFRFRGERVRRLSPVNSRRGAQEFERQARERLLTGRADPRNLPRFAEFAEEWFESYVKANNKASFVRTRRTSLDRHVLKFFGTMRLDLITSYQVERFKAQLRGSGYRHSSINGHLNTVSVALRCAVEWGLLQSAPRVKLLPAQPVAIEWLTKAEVRALLEHSGRWRSAIFLAVSTGLRWGEIFGLRWVDVSLPRKKLAVVQSLWQGSISTTKNHKAREVPISRALRVELMSVERRGDLVFCNTAGNPQDYNTALIGLKASAKAAGLGRVGWHTLRHTFASHAIQAGAGIRHVQQLLGHSSINHTARYSHLRESDLAAVVESVDFGQQEGNERAG